MGDFKLSFAIIIPTYNCDSYIGATLQSVLDQTQKADEVIIVDDGSSDNTISIAKEMGFDVVEQKNSGPAAARNHAVSLAKSDWIVFLDGDDLMEPRRIEVLAKAIEKDPNLNFLGNNEFEGRPSGPWEEKFLHLNYNFEESLYDQLLKGCFLSTSAMAIRRDLYQEVGGMDEGLRSAQDYDLWLRVAPKAKFHFIDQTLSRYIIRNESVTSNFTRRLNCMKAIFGKHYKSMGKMNLVRRILVFHAELLIASFRAGSFGHFFKIAFSLPISILRCLFGGRP